MPVNPTTLAQEALPLPAGATRRPASPRPSRPTAALADRLFAILARGAALVTLALWLGILASLVHGRKPKTPSHSVCLDCKRRGTVCVTVA